MKKQDTTLITFENHSVSGVDRMYGKFRMKIPGHAIGDKAVTLPVPDDLLEDALAYLKRTHPAITAVPVEAQTEGEEGPEVISNAEVGSAATEETSLNAEDVGSGVGDINVGDIVDAPAATETAAVPVEAQTEKKQQNNNKGGGRK
jgi:CBS domain-containing protein